jgi:hypothetical protein
LKIQKLKLKELYLMLVEKSKIFQRKPEPEQKWDFDVFASTMLEKEKVAQEGSSHLPLEKIKEGKQILMDAINSKDPEKLFATYRDQLQLLNLVVINEDSLKQDKSAELHVEFLERFLARDERLLKNLKDFINDESNSRERILEVVTRCMQLIQRQNQKEQEKIKEENERTKS